MELKKICYHALTFKVFIRTALIITMSFIFINGSQPLRQIQNPYENVDWTNHGQYKANLNTHTMVSNGWENPQSVVENYQKLDYRILAITDQNVVTYPWEKFSRFEESYLTFLRKEHLVVKPLEEKSISTEELEFKNVNPSEVGMVAIQGSKLSYEKHDVNSYFNDHTNSDINLFEAVADKNGLMVMNQPGKDKKDKFPLKWYVDLYKKYDKLVGMEIFDSRNRFQNNLALWDSILTKMAPVRPVWGFSNDNMLSMRDLGENWNVFILPELSEKRVRRAMKMGNFYIVNAPLGHKGPAPPIIKSVKVNRGKGIINIEAAGQDSIIWVSNGMKIGSGTQFPVNQLPEESRYVRAKIYGAGNSIVCTQPFMIKGSTF